MPARGLSREEKKTKSELSPSSWRAKLTRRAVLELFHENVSYHTHKHASVYLADAQQSEFFTLKELEKIAPSQLGAAHP